MRFNPHVTATAAVMLALGAIPPSALGNTTGNGPVVRPNPDEQVATSQLRAVATPAVQPNPDQQVPTSAGTPSEALSQGGHGTGGTPPVVVRVSPAQGGFDWGDAGVGAAGGVGLCMLGLAGAMTSSRRRSRRSTRSPAATS